MMVARTIEAITPRPPAIPARPVSRSGSSVLKVAAVSRYDLRDPNAYRGRLSPLLDGLRRHCEAFECLGPLSRRRHLPRLALKALWYRKILRKSYNVNRDRSLIRDYGRQIAAQLKGRDFNIVFSTTCNGSQPVAYLECPQRIVIWSDATFAGIIDFYPALARDRICREMLRDGLANERAALGRCALLVYKSDWAALSAIEFYGIDPRKIRVVPGGPGLDSGLTSPEAEAIVRARPRDRCRLLFVGAEWQRKGGDLALEVASELNRQGLPTELTIVGCRPDLRGRPTPPFVRCIGFLHKSDPKELEMLKAAFSRSHFLILPTRAEAMGVIFCEASAFALPSLATNVGGVTAAVIEGRNGRLFLPEEGAAAYCACITAFFRNYPDYLDLALSAFNEYRTRLNWNTATEAVTGYMREVL